MDKLIKFDLWGGDQSYDPETRVYSIVRDCGVFSNFAISLYGAMKCYEIASLPEKITLHLTEYFTSNVNVFDRLFEISNKPISFDDITEQEFHNFYRYFEPNFLGIGRSKEHFNFKIINRLVEKFFTPSKEVCKYVEQIIQTHKLDLSNTVFVWARKTDKVHEAVLPTAETYKKILQQNNLLDYQIVLQTDDITVLHDFQQVDMHFTTLNEIPYAEDGYGFHEKLSSRLSDDRFTVKHGYDKLEYIQKLLALAIIMSKCKACIVYPGCLATVTPIFRGSFEECYSFKTDVELIS